MGRRSFWNTSRGTLERELRKTLRNADIADIDAALIAAAMAQAKSVDHLMKKQEATMKDQMVPEDVYGDTGFAYHIRFGLSAYVKTLEACLLTPQTRAQYLTDQEPIVSPFAAELADVHSITRD